MIATHTAKVAFKACAAAESYYGDAVLVGNLNDFDDVFSGMHEDDNAVRCAGVV